MNKTLLMNFTVDKENNRIKVEREFAAPVENVWAAWTQPELMDQWWAPKPYQTKTKSMDFREGGYWLYAMIGPQGDTHWCRADYKSIKPLKSYTGLDAFCDEEGVIKEEFPSALWAVDFNAIGETTLVKIELVYENLSDLEKIIEMGFKEGFTMALSNLDQYFSAHL